MSLATAPEHRLQPAHALLRGARVGVCVVLEGRFVWVDPEFAAMFGATPATLCDGLGPLDLLARTDRGTTDAGGGPWQRGAAATAAPSSCSRWASTPNGPVRR